jgi:outer membrane protein TolC
MRLFWQLKPVLYFCAAIAAAQAPAPQVPGQTSAPVPAPMPTLPTGGQNPFLGGVPQGEATKGVLQLSFSDTLDRALKHNLGLLLGEQSTRIADGARMRALSQLLPNVTAGISTTSQQINLAALGFTGIAGFPQIIGPFSVYDARAFLSQQLVNISAIRGRSSENEVLRAARFSYQDARDIVVLVAANLYLQALAGRARIETSQAQLNTAKALYQRAVDMKNAGMAPGIDVLRAQVEMQAQQQRVIFFQNEFEKQKLSLARAIGLPTGQQFALSDRVPYTPPPPFTFEQALAEAYNGRADYRSAQAQVASAEEARKAAVAQRYPSLAISANYGALGQHPSSAHGTYAATANLEIPIFQGGRVSADVEQADAVLRQRRSQFDDLRTAIHYEIQTAFLDLKAAGEQVQVARSAVDLAGQQLTQAQDRFSAGVANTIEVVQAQEAVATANDNYISGLYAYNIAKASLARGMGGAEKTARQFLGVTGR